MPKAKVLIYETEDGTRIAARPSGTEPKVKFYITTNMPLSSSDKFAEVNDALDQKIQGILDELKLG